MQACEQLGAHKSEELGEAHMPWPSLPLRTVPRCAVTRQSSFMAAPFPDFSFAPAGRCEYARCCPRVPLVHVLSPRVLYAEFTVRHISHQRTNYVAVMS